MSKRVNRNYIDIDGAKLKDLLESATGKSLKEISLDNGFSDSFLRMVVKSGKATPAAQAVIRRYGIEPDAYKLKPVEIEDVKESSEEAKQLSIDDFITEDARDVLKAIIKEALREELLLAIDGDVIINRGENLKAFIRQVMFETPYIRVTGIDYDPKEQRFKLFANKENLT